MMKTTRTLLLCTALACLGWTGSASAQSVDSVADVQTKFDVAPRPLKTKPPRYPDKLREQSVSGAVVVIAVVDEAGKVIACEAGKATHAEFRDPALQAVRDWLFEPAKVAGKAVRARVSIPVMFSIGD